MFKDADLSKISPLNVCPLRDLISSQRCACNHRSISTIKDNSKISPQAFLVPDSPIPDWGLLWSKATGWWIIVRSTKTYLTFGLSNNSRISPSNVQHIEVGSPIYSVHLPYIEMLQTGHVCPLHIQNTLRSAHAPDPWGTGCSRSFRFIITLLMQTTSILSPLCSYHSSVTWLSSCKLYIHTSSLLSYVH